MTTWNEFAAVASKVGITRDALAATCGPTALLVLFMLRRPILRAVRFIVTAVFTLFLFALILGGCVQIYKHFGVLPAVGFTVGVALIVCLAARGGRGGENGASIDDEYLDQINQEESRRRDHEHQLREAERIHRNHYG